MRCASGPRNMKAGGWGRAIQATSPLARAASAAPSGLFGGLCKLAAYQKACYFCNFVTHVVTICIYYIFLYDLVTKLVTRRFSRVTCKPLNSLRVQLFPPVFREINTRICPSEGAKTEKLRSPVRQKKCEKTASYRKFSLDGKKSLHERDAGLGIWANPNF